MTCTMRARRLRDAAVHVGGEHAETGHTGEFLHFIPQLPVLLLEFENAHHTVQIDALILPSAAPARADRRRADCTVASRLPCAPAPRDPAGRIAAGSGVNLGDLTDLAYREDGQVDVEPHADRTFQIGPLGHDGRRAHFIQPALCW